MAKEYIVYTMKDKSFTNLVINQFIEKGYKPHDNIKHYVGKYDAVATRNNGIIYLTMGHELAKELTFRELCELTNTEIILEELGDYLATKLTQKASLLNIKLSEIPFCKLWEKHIKPKLDLGERALISPQ